MRKSLQLLFAVPLLSVLCARAHAQLGKLAMLYLYAIHKCQLICNCSCLYWSLCPWLYHYLIALLFPAVQLPTDFPICPARPCILPADCRVIVQPDPSSDPCGCPTCGDPAPIPVDCSAVLCLQPPCTKPLPPPPGQCCAVCPPGRPTNFSLIYKICTIVISMNGAFQ